MPAKVLAVAGPALVLAGLGFTHPTELSAATAPWWTTLHTLLMVIFPLLGLAHWVLLRGAGDVIAWISRIAAFGYATFYAALDVLAGIATGTLVQRGAEAEASEVAALFVVGNDLGTVGARCFLVACVATSVALITRVGRAAVPGAILLIAGAVPFLGSHIYWPAGVLSMVALAAGFALLALSDVSERVRSRSYQSSD